MIAGDRCTRACGFCAVTTAKPFALETMNRTVAEAVRRMNLKHVVVTAVARDDLKDGGADHFARTIEAIREMDRPSSSKCSFRIFTPKRNASVRCATPPRHFQSQRGNRGTAHAFGAFAGKVSPFLASLARAKEMSPEIVTKSGIMLGLGEKEPEIFQTMDDLREVGCEVLTMGQNFAPDPATFASRGIRAPPSNSITTGTSHAGKVFSTSPRGRWSAALITRLIFIRLCGDNRNNGNKSSAVVSAVLSGFLFERRLYSRFKWMR